MKEIVRNRLNRDYDMFLNGRYVGSRATHTEAQAELDRLAYDELTRVAA
jgi:hypothetical protein